jgi:hypothetical protein
MKNTETKTRNTRKPKVKTSVKSGSLLGTRMGAFRETVVRRQSAWRGLPVVYGGCGLGVARCFWESVYSALWPNGSARRTVVPFDNGCWWVVVGGGRRWGGGGSSVGEEERKKIWRKLKNESEMKRIATPIHFYSKSKSFIHDSRESCDNILVALPAFSISILMSFDSFFQLVTSVLTTKYLWPVQLFFVFLFRREIKEVMSINISTQF